MPWYSKTKAARSGEIAGVLACYAFGSLNGYFEHYKRLRDVEFAEEKLKKRLFLVSTMRDQPIFRKTLQQCGADRILGLKTIAVAKRFRGRGLATALVMERYVWIEE